MGAAIGAAEGVGQPLEAFGASGCIDVSYSDSNRSSVSTEGKAGRSAGQPELRKRDVCVEFVVGQGLTSA